MKALGVLASLLAVLASAVAAMGAAGQRDMRLVGAHDLHGRAAYQPVIVRQGDRWIAYVGHHGGRARNPLTGAVEPNGTSILDVTDPRRPAYLAHIPGEPGGGESGGAQMVRVCGGRELPHAPRDRTYLLRTLGNAAHEIWDVSEAARPALVTTVVGGLAATHKNWWECASGIAYLVSDGRPAGWRTSRMTKIYDLSDPAAPRFVRDFGLPGQEPGAPAAPVPAGVHGPIALGDRVYLAYGTSRDGVLQIVDRTKLLRGDPASAAPMAPTAANLRYPELGRLDLPSTWGGHTAFPLHGVPIADWAPWGEGHVRDFVVLVSEALASGCQEVRHLTFVVDVTVPATPLPVATFQVPAASGDFCRRGGRFGPHATNESFTPRFYPRVVFLSYFNAGVRAVDVRDPFRPTEIAYFIPAPGPGSRCVRVDGAERCRPVVQTNNVEVDDRGYVYLTDRAGGGLHIVELTGAARALLGPR